MGSPMRLTPAESGTRARTSTRLWVESELPGSGGASRDLLRDIFAARAEVPLRALAGRATFRWPADSAVVVKRYSAPVWGDLVHDLLRGRARSVARREAENLRDLALAGLRVPRLHGWCDEGAFGARSALWMEHLEHSGSLMELAARAPRAAVEYSSQLARAVALLHMQGWYHRDLYLAHWLVTAQGLVLVDVGRARRERSPRERWFVKDVAALLHSTPSAVPHAARLRFLAHYLDARGVTSHDGRRRFARAVLAKAARIAAHAPRWVDRTSGT